MYRWVICGLAAVAITAGAASATDEERQRLLRYGAQLAEECFTCHRRDGVDVGIPDIVSMTERELLTALTLYKTGLRKNKVVTSVAASLDETQIRALVMYLSSLKKEPGTRAPSVLGLPKK